MSDKTCLLCKRFYMYSGSPCYSEYTPGEDMEMGCNENHWDFSPNEDTDESFRRKMASAENCKDFSLYKKE